MCMYVCIKIHRYTNTFSIKYISRCTPHNTLITSPSAHWHVELHRTSTQPAFMANKIAKMYMSYSLDNNSYSPAHQSSVPRHDHLSRINPPLPGQRFL